MPRDDDSFWVAIFRKSPLIATLMAIGLTVGTLVGGWQWRELARYFRLYLCILAGGGLAGAGLGLIVGVVIDTFIGIFRKDKKKRRRKD